MLHVPELANAPEYTIHFSAKKVKQRPESKTKRASVTTQEWTGQTQRHSDWEKFRPIFNTELERAGYHLNKGAINTKEGHLLSLSQHRIFADKINHAIQLKYGPKSKTKKK